MLIVIFISIIDLIFLSQLTTWKYNNILIIFVTSIGLFSLVWLIVNMYNYIKIHKESYEIPRPKDDT